MKLLRLVLISLAQADGLAFPEKSLISAVGIAARPDEPTDADIRFAIKQAEDRLWISGVSDDLVGRTWTLTVEGTHKARQLR